MFRRLPAPGHLRSTLTALATLAVVVLPSAASAARTTDVLPAYDAVRASLAGDDLAAAAKAAARLEATSKEAASAAAHPAQHQLHALAAAAGRVASAKDLEGARAAFGDASRTLLTILAADPALAKGVVAYRCPMTKTYKKWIQLGGPMANPYMGQRMLHCGRQVPIAP